MNEYLLSQIDKNKPALTHRTLYKIRNLDNLYHACVTLNSSFGELEIDDNANSNDVYDIMTSFLGRNGVNVEYKSTNLGVHLSFEYEFPISAYFVDITDFYSIKKVDESLYTIMLRCMVVISKYCFNVLYDVDMCKDFIENCLEEREEEDDQLEIERALLMLERNESLKNDFMAYYSEDNCTFLENYFINETANPLCPSLIRLVELVLLNHEQWKCLMDSRPYNSDEYTISFTEYTGFKFSKDHDVYEQYHNDHLQSFFEEGWISACFDFEAESVRNIYPLKRSSHTLYRAIDLFETVMLEVENA